MTLKALHVSHVTFSTRSTLSTSSSVSLSFFASSRGLSPGSLNAPSLVMASCHQLFLRDIVVASRSFPHNSTEAFSWFSEFASHICHDDQLLTMGSSAIRRMRLPRCCPWLYYHKDELVVSNQLDMPGRLYANDLQRRRQQGSDYSQLARNLVIFDRLTLNSESAAD